MKNQANMTLPKETNNIPITNPKEMDIYELPFKEFKTIILKKFSERHKNTDNQMKSGR